MNKTRVYWILQITGWSFFAAINMVLAFFQGNFNHYSFFYSLLLSVWFIVSTHLFRNYLIKKGWLEPRIKKVVFRILLSLAVITLINFVVHLLILSSLGVFDASYDLDPANVGVYVLSTFFIYFLWTLFYIIFHYFERYNAALKYEALISEIELNNLKSQLNPHFIFNALNSIRALVDENPARSKDAITLLSNILRNSLVSNRNKLISFQEEFSSVKDYLELESIRFEERLRVKFDIDPKSASFLVPPMMIQTLVENGIKHGISRLKEGGQLRLTTKVKDSALHVKITNNGHLDEEKLTNPRGLGIENTKQRLKLLYGQHASFRIFNDDNHMVATELILPQKN